MMDACRARNLPVELFGDPSNARYFKNWKFAPADCPLPQVNEIGVEDKLNIFVSELKILSFLFF